jgi:trimeric autotransporter adhesin
MPTLQPHTNLVQRLLQVMLRPTLRQTESWVQAPQAQAHTHHAQAVPPFSPPAPGRLPALVAGFGQAVVAVAFMLSMQTVLAQTVPPASEVINGVTLTYNTNGDNNVGYSCGRYGPFGASASSRSGTSVFDITFSVPVNSFTLGFTYPDFHEFFMSTNSVATPTWTSTPAGSVDVSGNGAYLAALDNNAGGYGTPKQTTVTSTTPFTTVTIVQQSALNGGCLTPVTVTAGPSVTLRKTWSAGATAGNAITVTTTGGSANATISSTAVAGGNTTTGTPVAVTGGNTITFPAETFTNGSQANYTTSIACTGNTNALSSSTLPATLLIASGDRGITCTYTNTPLPPPTLQLSKAWAAGATAGDVANIGATSGGSANTAAFSSTAPTVASSNVVNVAVGNTITLPAETMSGGVLPNYTTTLSCTANGGATANTLSGTNGQVSNTLLIGAGDAGKAIVCTYTNGPALPNLVITTHEDSYERGTNVGWRVGANSGYKVVVTNFGPVTVPNGGTTITYAFPANMDFIGLSGFSNINWACTSPAGIALSYPVSSSTLDSFGRRVMCRYLPGLAPNGSGIAELLLVVRPTAVTGDGSGITSRVSVANDGTNTLTDPSLCTAQNTPTAGCGVPLRGIPVAPAVSTAQCSPVYGVGSGTVAGVAVTSSHSGSVTTGGSLPGPICGTLDAVGPASGGANGAVTVGQSGSFILTYNFASTVNNIRVMGVVSDGVGGEAFTVNTNTGSPALIYNKGCGASSWALSPGSYQAGTAPATIGATDYYVNRPGGYTSLTISGPGGNNGSTLAICADDPSLTLQKTWSAGATAGNAITVTTTGGSANATVSSTAVAGGNTTTGTAVTVTAGNTITFPAETFTNGSQSSYTTSISCTGNTNALSSSTLPATLLIASADSAITCTYTNTLKPAPTLSLQKALGGTGRINAADQFKMNASGDTAATTASALASTTSAGTGAVVDAGTGLVTFTGAAGTAYTLDEAMTATSVSTLAQYIRTVSCTNTGTTNVTGFTSLPITVTPALGDVIVCTVTNSPAPTVTVTKVSNNSVGAFTFPAGTNGWAAQTITTTTAGVGVAGAAQPLAAASTVTDISETLPAGYTLTSIACTGLGSGGAEYNLTNAAVNGVPAHSVRLNAAATASGNAIACTFTNTLTTVDLSVSKTNNLAGTVDVTGDTVARGQGTSYRIIVTNNGPQAVTGAVVNDPSAAGLNCTSLTCTGTACPATAPTVANLQSPGVTLGTLPVSGTTTLDLTCTVN